MNEWRYADECCMGGDLEPECMPCPNSVVYPTSEACGLVHGIALALIFWVLIVALALLLQAVS